MKFQNFFHEISKFWQDFNGNEVDLLTRERGLFDLFKGMDYFSAISNGKVHTRTLIYGGEDSHDRTNYLVRQWQEV